MTTHARYSLGAAFRHLEATGKIHIKQWRDAQDLSAARFGLLLCGDLALAKKVLDAEPRPPDALSPDEVMKDLCALRPAECTRSTAKSSGSAPTSTSSSIEDLTR
jgi:hypothetical protein